MSAKFTTKNWLRGQDSNLRSPAYEADELPGFSTPRQNGGEFLVFDPKNSMNVGCILIITNQIHKD